MTLPNFFVVGAPKSGTTSLHALLSLHPEIGMSPVKEPKFFMCDGRPPTPSRGPGDSHAIAQHVWEANAYERLFADVATRPVRGESSPFYLYDRAALSRIRRLLPDARLIALLRQPEVRAHSNWVDMRTFGREPIRDFLEACEAETTRRSAGWEPYWHYKSVGRYGEQLEFLFSLFKRDQVKVILAEDFAVEPTRAVNDVCAFLGVARDAIDDAAFGQRQNMTRFVEPTYVNRGIQALLYRAPGLRKLLPTAVRARGRGAATRYLARDGAARPDMSPVEVAVARDWYTDDVDLLSRLTDLDLSAWTSQTMAPQQ